MTILQGLQQKKLVAQSRKLLQEHQKTQNLLEELEKANPGITKIEMDEDGAIMMDDSEGGSRRRAVAARRPRARDGEGRAKVRSGAGEGFAGLSEPRRNSRHRLNPANPSPAPSLRRGVCFAPQQDAAAARFIWTTKKRISLALAFCGMLFLMPAAYAQTCGILSNSGFESDLSGWSGSGPVSIVGDAHGGTKAARVGTAQGGVNRSATFAVTAGQSLTFQFWAKVTGNPSWAGVGLDFLNASGAEISEINTQITGSAYALRTTTRVVPAGAVAARIWTWKSGSTGYLFLDDFCVTVPDSQAPSIPMGLSSAAVTTGQLHAAMECIDGQRRRDRLRSVPWRRVHRYRDGHIVQCHGPGARHRVCHARAGA